MTQPLHSKSPSFIGDKKINLSWKETVKQVANALQLPPMVLGLLGRGEGGVQSQLVNRALEGLSRGGRRGARVRGWSGRGRGRGYR